MVRALLAHVIHLFQEKRHGIGEGSLTHEGLDVCEGRYQVPHRLTGCFGATGCCSGTCSLIARVPLGVQRHPGRKARDRSFATVAGFHSDVIQAVISCSWASIPVCAQLEKR